MSRLRSFAIAIFGLLGLLLTTAAQADVFINFNDLVHGVDVTNQYEGVSFQLVGQPGQGPVAYALKDGNPANTGNDVTVLNISDGLAITPFNPQNGFSTNCSPSPFVPCEDFIVTFDAPINYFSILALDAEEPFTATAYLGDTPVSSVTQGMFLGNNPASVFNGPVYRVEFGAFDGANAFDKIVFDITPGGPELFDNIRYNRLDDSRLRAAEPDRFAPGTDLRTVFPGITLSVTNRPSAAVLPIDGFKAIPGTGITRYLSTTGSLIFGNTPDPSSPIQGGEAWGDEYYGNLRIDFDAPTDFVQVDLIHGDDGISILRAYDGAGNLLQEIVELGNGVGSQGDDCPPFCEPVITAAITRPSPDIAYVVAGGQGFEPCLLDNLQYNLVTFTAQVGIDIKPGSDSDCLNINGHGVIPVAILGSAEFDVQTIDRTTLSFAGLAVRQNKKGDLQCHLEDTNIDGYWDLVCQYEDDPTKWMPDSETEASLTGNFLDGTAFQGTDSICLRPEKDEEEPEATQGEQDNKGKNTTEDDNLDPRPWW